MGCIHDIPEQSIVPSQSIIWNARIMVDCLEGDKQIASSTVCVSWKIHVIHGQETMNDSLQMLQVMVSPLTAIRFISVLQ